MNVKYKKIEILKRTVNALRDEMCPKMNQMVKISSCDIEFKCSRTATTE